MLRTESVLNRRMFEQGMPKDTSCKPPYFCLRNSLFEVRNSRHGSPELLECCLT